MKRLGRLSNTTYCLANHNITAQRSVDVEKKNTGNSGTEGNEGSGDEEMLILILLKTGRKELQKKKGQGWHGWQRCV